MHARVFFGASAWLIGAGAATVGSLLAVSLIGQGIGGNPGQQLTTAAVQHALALEAADSHTDAPVIGRSHAVRHRHPRHRAKSRSAPPPATPSPATTPTASGTALSSSGGELVAECRGASAYLMSWSPQQGYEIDDVSRGPAATARVTFGSGSGSVVMVVSCRGGMPVLTTYRKGRRDE